MCLSFCPSTCELTQAEGDSLCVALQRIADKYFNILVLGLTKKQELHFIFS